MWGIDGMNKALKAALWYAKQGFSVIPCRAPYADKEGKDVKIPQVEWKEYQDRRATEDEIKAWYEKFPDARLGIVTGKISNIMVVDADSEKAKAKIDELLPDSLVVPCLLYTSPSPRDGATSRMPSSA